MRDKSRGQPTRGAIGRVRDDMIDERGAIGEKIMRAAPVTAIDEVAAEDLESSSLEDAADRAVSACALPQQALEGFVRQQRARPAWRRGVIAFGMLVEVVQTIAEAGGFRQPSFALRFKTAEDGRAGHAFPIHQPPDEQIGRPPATGFLADLLMPEHMVSTAQPIDL
jgi:hypothetical protein